MNSKIVRVLISPSTFTRLFEQGKSWTIIEGLPSESKLLNLYFNEATNTYSAIFEHPSFEEVPEGELIGIKEIVFSSILKHDQSETSILQDAEGVTAMDGL